ncbi:MAG TPA: hypothetical protein P5121_39725 [Caldilineaceae bacterium]|nr:hypothetical protein [Caldilineaceae bacterium]
MIPLTTMSATRPGSPWLAAVLAAILSAIFAFVASFFLQSDQLIPFVIALLLVGACPILGYAFASGRIGGSIGGVIGGIIGAIPVVSIILWPLLVGILTRSQSIGKLFLGNIIGIVVALALFFALASTIGQDPSWFNTAFILTATVWGGICGALMTNWAKY